MTTPSAVGLADERRHAAESLAADVRRVFGLRLHSVVAYGIDEGGPLHTMVLVERITFEDLAACARMVSAWRRREMAVPLLLERNELTRSLDAFALEYTTIAAAHVVIEGPDPFAGIEIADVDLRRACERQAKSHLIHLREGFLETGGDGQAVAALIGASVPGFEALLVNIARLEGQGRSTSSDAGRGGGEDLAARAAQVIGLPPALLEDVRASRTSGTIVDPTALLSRYLAAAERTWQFVDGWRAD
jgi:hypothetical protein